jgi:hypothetical protein
MNETLVADRVALAAVDAPADRTLVVDEAIRLGRPTPPLLAWSLGAAATPRCRLDGADVTDAIAAEDLRTAGYVRPLPWIGLAEAFSLEVDLDDADGLLLLEGSLNFPNASALYAASQAGVSPIGGRLEVREGVTWRELTPDCGVPAGFFKEVVVDLRAFRLRGPATLRLTTNLQVSWDRVAFFRDVVAIPASAFVPVPLVRAVKSWHGIVREVKGADNRWREYPHDDVDGRSDWRGHGGPVTPDGDVADLLDSPDGHVAFVRAGEEVQLGFDGAALAPPAPDMFRHHVLLTRGWVKDADPHTAQSLSVLPLPEPGKATYP